MSKKITKARTLSPEMPLKMAPSRAIDKKAKSCFIVLNEKGLHTRPSVELVKCAANYRSVVHLSYRDYVVNAKSILGILMLAAERGAKIAIEAIGDDAQEAISALLALANNRFNMNY